MGTNSFEQMGAGHAYAPATPGDIAQTLMNVGVQLAEGSPAMLCALLLLAGALAVQVLNRA